MFHILVIDNDLDDSVLITTILEMAGYGVTWASDGIKGQVLARQLLPDFIMLDINLPKADGFTICRRLRRDDCTAEIPILILTALGQLQDKVEAFNAGADDYLTKPFATEEMLARIQAILRRKKPNPKLTEPREILSYGPLTLLPERLEAIWFDRIVKLTPLECEIIRCLLQRPHQTVSSREILQWVWGYDPDDDIESIRVHVRNLRKKLEPDRRDPRYLKTIYGEGYRLELPSFGRLPKAARQASFN